MAGTATLRYSGVNNDTYGYEVFDCALTTPTTAFTITPTLVKAIDMATVTPTNAAAATAGGPYVTSFVPGNKTVVVTGVTDSTFLVKIEGKVA